MEKKLGALFLVLSLVGLGVGYYLTNSQDFGLCVYDVQANIYDVSCHAFYERIGDPLFYGMGALAVVFLLLLVVPQAFPAWKKFAIWFMPIAALLFIFYPDPGSGDLLSPYPEQVFQWVSGLYLVVSVFIIAYKYMQTENGRLA